MSDLRDEVDEDRGLLKRIQLHVPGFAGYRRREDIRTADNMLRIQMADMLKAVRSTVEDARQELTESGQYKHLDRMGRVLNRLRSLEGRVRHAEGGYSGISADIRIEEMELNRLYEYDASLLDDVAALGDKTAELRTAATDGGEVRPSVREIKELLDRLEDTFQRRIRVVAGTEVRP